MIQKIVNGLIEKQLSEKKIMPEDINIYKYGYTLVCEMFINIVISIFIGIIFKDLFIILGFLCLYIPLRSFCGGWHADKAWKCTIYSNLILVILVIVNRYCMTHLRLNLMILAFIICILLVFISAPIDTKSKPISIEEKKIFKKKINIILIIHAFIMIGAIILNLKKAVFILMYVYIIQTIMLVLELINKKVISKGVNSIE